MTITKITCKLLNEDVGVCPLKPAWVKTCPFSFSCNVKRKYRKYDKKPNIEKNDIKCDVIDCDNNIIGNCDTKHEVNDKGSCQTYIFNKEWFLKSLNRKVHGEPKNDE